MTSSSQPTGIHPIGYIFAPIVPATLNIFFVPLVAVVAGRPENAAYSMVWMCIAWFGLESICLATMAPLLWLLRHRITVLPVSTRTATVFAIAFSGLASLLLFHPPRVQYAVGWSWLCAAVSSTFALLLFRDCSSRQKGSSADSQIRQAPYICMRPVKAS